jgi:hypothetical protein
MSDGITLGGKLLFPSKYLGAADLKGQDVTLVIDHMNIDALQMVGGRKEAKPVLYFRKPKDNTPIDKMLVCNKTNARTIAKLYGKEVEGWAGKKITLYPTTTTCGRNTVDCIRIREQVPGAPRLDPPPACDELPAQDDTDYANAPEGATV